MAHKPKKVLLLGSGALKIGEAGEFDYSALNCALAMPITACPCQTRSRAKKRFPISKTSLLRARPDPEAASPQLSRYPHLCKGHGAKSHA